MIEINLLPGAGKRSKARASGMDMSSAFSNVAQQIKDPFLIGSIVAVAVAVLAVGGLFLRSYTVSRALTKRQEIAQADSTRLALQMTDRLKTQAQRDTMLLQLNIIRSIDNNRFTWAHLLDEISRALPPYTWLTEVNQTSSPVSVAAAVVVDTSKKAGAAAKKKSDSTQPVQDTVSFRIQGNTVDIQALTRFMRDLEASPFVQNVQLSSTALAVVDGKEVTQFELTAQFEQPDPRAIKTVPLVATVR